MKKQAQRILEYLEEFGSISSREAFLDLGVMRLSARIFDLKSAGYEFEEAFETAKNRFGEPVSYKRYALKAEGNRE